MKRILLQLPRGGHAHWLDSPLEGLSSWPQGFISGRVR